MRLAPSVVGERQAVGPAAHGLAVELVGEVVVVEGDLAVVAAEGGREDAADREKVAPAPVVSGAEAGGSRLKSAMAVRLRSASRASREASALPIVPRTRPPSRQRRQ
jgi:hypothetical protein